MKKFKVPVNEPYLFGNEKKYLQKCIRDGFVSSSGPFVEKFEKKFAKRLKRKFAISVSNGTAALQLAFESLNIKKKRSSNTSLFHNHFMYITNNKMRRCSNIS